jgi:uncharacterized RDD family membrane protein YckC
MECPNCHRQTSPASRRCMSCGAEIPPGQFLLERSGVLPAVTSAPVEPHHPSDTASFNLATFGDRFLAVVLDSIVLLAAFAIVDTWAFLRWSDIAGIELNLTAASLVISGLLDALIFFAYVWLLEAALGATLGKVIIGIRVLHDDGRNRLAASAIRNALRIVDGLAFYLVGAMVASFSKLRQRVGDICAETIVVAEDFHAGIKAAAVLLWLAALAGAVWSIPRLRAGANAGHQPRYLRQVVAQLGRTDNSAYIRLDRLRIDVQLVPGRTAGPTTSVPSPLPESR